MIIPNATSTQQHSTYHNLPIGTSNQRLLSINSSLSLDSSCEFIVFTNTPCLLDSNRPVTVDLTTPTKTHLQQPTLNTTNIRTHDTTYAASSHLITTCLFDLQCSANKKNINWNDCQCIQVEKWPQRQETQGLINKRATQTYKGSIHIMNYKMQQQKPTYIQQTDNLIHSNVASKQQQLLLNSQNKIIPQLTHISIVEKPIQNNSYYGNLGNSQIQSQKTVQQNSLEYRKRLRSSQQDTTGTFQITKTNRFQASIVNQIAKYPQATSMIWEFGQSMMRTLRHRYRDLRVCAGIRYLAAHTHADTIKNTFKGANVKKFPQLVRGEWGHKVYVDTLRMYLRRRQIISID